MRRAGPGAGATVHVPPSLENRHARPDLDNVSDRPDPRPVPPEKPLPGDCCGGGCAVCVNDAYEDEREDYEARLAAWLQRHPEGDPAG